MNKAVIVHCWGGYSEYCWYPSVKKELEENGFYVSVPAMPQTDAPKLSLWLPKLQETVGNPDEALYLIGHSAGCITIMRYLEQLSDDQKVGGVVFVAGFSDDLKIPELKNFFQTPIDFLKIKSKARQFVAIHSDNDPYVAVSYGEILREKLGAKLLVKHNMGHFSGPVDNENSCISLPDVTKSVLEMSSLK